MFGKLRFELNLKAHPYLEDPSAHLEAWSEICLCIEFETEYLILAKFEWDIVPFAEWFVQVRSDLLNENLSISDPLTGIKYQPFKSESLAKALYRLRQRDFLEIEDQAEYLWSNQLYEFYWRHGLWFAFPGSRIEDIIIGCNANLGEISLWRKDSSWIYRFEMSEFCKDLREKLFKILYKWSGGIDVNDYSNHK